MDPKELDAILKQTLGDGKLSRSERQALSQVLQGRTLDAQQKSLFRTRAFEAARSVTDPARFAEVLEWLEDVMGVLVGNEDKAGASMAEVHFSPGEVCVQRIVGLLSSARQSADICVFTITDDRIARAIRDASHRKVRIRIVTDNEKAFDPGSDVEALARDGIPVAVDISPYHMHHKFAIFDDRLLLTGSYNWTRGAALNNEENFLVTDDPRFLGPFQKEFENLWQKFKG